MPSRYRYPRLVGVTLTLFTLALLGAMPPCHAQNTPDPPGAPSRADVRDLREVLEGVSYDPATQGPLLVVAPGQFTAKRPLPPKGRPIPSLRLVAAAARRKMIRVGGVTTLAPEEMMVITANPEKARPLAGMNLTQPFLASLTPEQWQLAGTARGIGKGDLTPEQQLMYETMLPDAPRVVTNRWVADPDDPTGRKRNLVRVGEPIHYERSAIRLRLSLSTRYRFYTSDGKPSYYGNYSFIGQKVGDTERLLVGESYDGVSTADEAERREVTASTAYGVRLRYRIPSRLKPSQLDYASPTLNVPIPLAVELKTVRDVLMAIGQRTGLELRADLRVAELPLYLRATSEQTARAGDLLMALAWGITGAYRRMDERVFLLTDDIEGIGTRVARLAFWAIEADQTKRDILENSVASAGKQNPLRYLRYDANAPGALPEDLRTRIAEDWGKPKSDGFLPIRTADLPDSVRGDVERNRRAYLEFGNPIHLDPSQVKISLSLGRSFVLPDGSEAGKTDESDLLFRMMTADRKVEAPSVETPTSTPKNLTRSVVMVAPTTAEEAAKLVAAIKRSGMTEVWVHVPLKGSGRPDTVPITAVIAAGKEAGIGVYAVVSLLKGEGVGTPERNILGQDGDTLSAEATRFYTRLYANRSDSAEQIAAVKRRAAKYRGWLTPDAELRAVREKQLQELAAVPGLLGITLRDTEAPGYTTDFVSEVNGRLGYTPAQRLACLREKGFDPIDVPPGTAFYLPISFELPFFPPYELQTKNLILEGGGIGFGASPWWSFLEGRNKALLAALYASLKEAHPTLALYIDDRASSYPTQNPSWFGSWDAANRFAREISGVGFDIRALLPGRTLNARRTSKTVLLLYSHNLSSGNPDEPSEFARAVTQFGARAASEWDGLVLDLSELPISDVLRLLDGVRPHL